MKQRNQQKSPSKPEQRTIGARHTLPAGSYRHLTWLIVAIAVGFFAWHAHDSSVLQDDSYITYRYARNVARGHGPVFNPEERVEGYTNFLWMMLWATLAVIGLPFSVIIPLSQVIGVICGIGIIILFYLLLRRYSRGPPLANALAPLLLAANGAFTYWCVSGMDSPLFTLLLAAAAWFWLDWLTIDPDQQGNRSTRSLVSASVLLGLSALTRPEGAMFFALFCLHFIIRSVTARNLFAGQTVRRFIIFIVPFVILVAPLYIWRLSYYGLLFPNTFYAKTGTSVEYFRAGIRYLWFFLQAYGLWGLALIVPIGLAAAKKRLRPSDPLFFCLLLLVVHMLYIVWVGGDVLRNWRFFVPVLFLFYFLLVEGIWLLRLPRPFSAALLVALVPLTFIGPFTSPRTVRQEIRRNLQLEHGLISKMTATGHWLNSNLAPDEWFAATTIGAVSYYSDRNMVDMLGLTDGVIAHNPEQILVSEWHWLERNYNTAHVLSRDPVYVYFSTGIKPSAEAERALFLRPRFRRGYFACLVTIFGESDGQAYQFTETIYKAKPGNDTIPMEPVAAPGRFINLYLDAINALRYGPDSAAVLFRDCVAEAPDDFAAPWEWLGQIEHERGRVDLAVQYYREALSRDDWQLTSHRSLAAILYGRGDVEGAVAHLRKLVEYAPDYFDGYAALAELHIQLENRDEAEQLISRARSRFRNLPSAAANHLDRLRHLVRQIEQ